MSKYYKELEKQEEQITSLEVSKDLADEFPTKMRQDLFLTHFIIQSDSKSKFLCNFSENDF